MPPTPARIASQFAFTLSRNLFQIITFHTLVFSPFLHPNQSKRLSHSLPKHRGYTPKKRTPSETPSPAETKLLRRNPDSGANLDAQ
jgi:hypothetical protein